MDEKTRAAKRKAGVAREMAHVPPMYRGIYERACNGTASKRDAIKAHCLMCVCWERVEIARCTSWSCPLYNYRPYQPREAPEPVHAVAGQG